MTDAAASVASFRVCDKNAYWIWFCDKFQEKLPYYWSPVAFCCASSLNPLVLPLNFLLFGMIEWFGFEGTLTM